MPEYLARLADGVLDELMQQFPAVVLQGPRATGKTTTAQRRAATAVRLDRPAEAAVFRADPDAALRGLDEPILLDEWQLVPDVLGAVKRAVDADSHPGRFLLTGSARAPLDQATWPLTGRGVHLSLYGLTVREIKQATHGPSLIEHLLQGDPPTLPREVPDLLGYVELAVRGGFPESALRTPAAANRWLASYVDQLVTHDVATLDEGRDPNRLRRYLHAYALNSAGIVRDTVLIESAGINRKTALAYEQLLTNLFVVEAIPAWTRNRLKQLTRSPKRYVTDAGLIVGVLGLDVRDLMRDADLLGRTLDTFVTAQLRAEFAALHPRPSLFHLREEHGRQEIDLLTELGPGSVVAFEVKADATPGSRSGRHLAWLRDRVGEAFHIGIVFHTGPRVVPIGDRILAVPICALWA